MKKLIFAVLIAVMGLTAVVPVFVQGNADTPPTPGLTLIQQVKEIVNTQIVNTPTGVQIRITNDPNQFYLNEKLVNLYLMNYLKRGLTFANGRFSITTSLIENGFAFNINSSAPQYVGKIQTRIAAMNVPYKISEVVQQQLALYGFEK